MILPAPKRILAVLLFCVCSLVWGMPGSLAEPSAQANVETENAATLTEVYPGLSINASMGYEGNITYLRKLPVDVTLKNDGPDFEGVLALNVYRAQAQYDRYEMPVSVASGAVVEVKMQVELTTKQPAYQLELLAGGEKIADFPIGTRRVLNPEVLLVGVLGGQSLTHFHITTGRDPLKRQELWQTVPLTEKSFPDNNDAMETFAFLAIDGFDVRSLNDRQQQALAHWLRKGGVAIVGGAAQAGTSYPYFEQYTGIASGAPYQAEDETPAILSHLKLADEPFGQEMMLVEMKGAKNVAIKGETPLLDVTPVGSGYVVTAAFSLSDRPFVTWQGNLALWQRLMLSTLGEHYQRLATLQKEFHQRGNGYMYSGILYGIQVPNDGGFLFPLILLGIFLLSVGIGSYWVLKKRDKREWLWLTVPALSLLFAAGFLLVSQWTTLNQPMAVISDYIAQSENGEVTEKAMVGMAMGKPGNMAIATNDGEIVPAFYDTYYDEGIAEGAPEELGTTYWQGPIPNIAYAVKGPWWMQNFWVKGGNPPPLKVDAHCWFEEDGIYFTLKNEGEIALEKGYILTNYGYCSTEPLLPGQSAEYQLKKLPKDAKVATENGNGNFQVSDGVMFPKARQANIDIYSITHMIAYPEAWTDSKTYVAPQNREEQSDLQSMLERACAEWGRDSGNQFHYISFDDSLCRMSFTLNGQPVLRTAQQNILDVTLKYHPISESGYANFTSADIPVYTAEKNAGQEPTRAVELKERYRYFRLTDRPAFCFVLPAEIEKIKISDFSIVPQYAYSTYEIALYNYKTKDWDTVDGKKPIADQLDLSVHRSKDGELFVQFSPGSTNTDTYSEVGIPMMTLEGRIQ